MENLVNVILLVKEIPNIVLHGLLNSGELQTLLTPVLK